jgi:hypothetical protein
MSVNWSPEVQMFDLAGLNEAIAKLKPRRRNGDGGDEDGDEHKGLTGKLISAAGFDRCTINKTMLTDEKLSKMRRRVELVCFRRKMKSEEVVAEVAKMGKLLATPAYILAIGFLYPDEQKTAPIVQLDPTGESEPIVLSTSCYGRNATPGHFDGPGWPEHIRFVVVDPTTELLAAEEDDSEQKAEKESTALTEALEWV